VDCCTGAHMLRVNTYNMHASEEVRVPALMSVLCLDMCRQTESGRVTQC
jgi:hypothetical protein